MKTAEEINREIVRVSKTAWKDKRGMHTSISLLFQRRKSAGHCVLENEIDMVGAEDALAKIINLDAVENGRIYQVIVCNEKHDWETGLVDDYDFKLVPHNENTLAG